LINLVLQKFNNSFYLYLFSVSKYIIQVSEKYWHHNKIDGTQTHSGIIYTINERVYVCVSVRVNAEAITHERAVQD